MEKDDLEKFEALQNNSHEKVLIYDTRQLFGQQNEIIIKHQEAVYRLRITKNDKLIMNK